MHYWAKHDYQEIVDILNARGLRSGDGHTFNVSIVGEICKNSGLKSRRERLREKGMLTMKELLRKVRVNGLKDHPLAPRRPDYRLSYQLPN